MKIILIAYTLLYMFTLSSVVVYIYMHNQLTDWIIVVMVYIMGISWNISYIMFCSIGYNFNNGYIITKTMSMILLSLIFAVLWPIRMFISFNVYNELRDTTKSWIQ